MNFIMLQAFDDQETLNTEHTTLTPINFDHVQHVVKYDYMSVIYFANSTFLTVNHPLDELLEIIKEVTLTNLIGKVRSTEN